MFKYKLIHRDTSEVATYGDDNSVVFGGPWGARDEHGKPYYVWVENTVSPEEIQVQHLAALDAEYQPQFQELQLAWAAASMDGNTDLAAGIQQDYLALKSKYQTKKEAIINGNI